MEFRDPRLLVDLCMLAYVKGEGNRGLVDERTLDFLHDRLARTTETTPFFLRRSFSSWWETILETDP